MSPKSWSYRLLGLERPPERRRQRRAELAQQGWPNAVRKARAYERELDGGHRTYQQVAEGFGVTRATVCQYLTIIRRLPDDVLRVMESETRLSRVRAPSMKRLVQIARLDSEKERRAAIVALLGASTPDDRVGGARHSPGPWGS